MKRKPTITYGAGQVAAWLGVTPAAVANWIRRWPEDIPQPDVVIATPGGIARGWKNDRIGDWEAFFARHHRPAKEAA